MGGVLRYNTDADFVVGPVLDSGGAAKTDEVIDNIMLVQDGVVFSPGIASTLTHLDSGKYLLHLDAADVNNGMMQIMLFSGTNDMPIQTFQVVTQEVYDAFFASGSLGDVNLTRINGELTSGNNATLYLKQLHVENDAGSAVVANSTGGDGHGIDAGGNGVGSGIGAYAGETGHGLYAEGGMTTGHGIYAYAPTDGAGQKSEGTDYGQHNVGTDFGQFNTGSVVGQQNSGVNYGQRNDGGSADIGLTTSGTIKNGTDDNLLQVNTDWLDGGRLDMILDSRASSAEVLAIQNNTRVVRVVPTIIERPASGTVTYRIELLLYDAIGNMEAPDSAPTIALVNQTGTDRSSRLDSTTMALVSTGYYRAIYTADTSHSIEQLVWTFSVVEGGVTRTYGNTTILVDAVAVDFTSSDRTTLQTIATDVAGLDGAAMRGTDGAYTGTPPTVGQIRTELESDGGKLDHLWEMTEDDGGVRRYTTNSLEQAPTGGSAPTVVQIRQEMDSNSTQLAAIAADVAGLDGAAMRGTDGAYTGTPPTAAAIRTEIDANSTKLDVAVSTRLASAGYTAPDNAGVAAVKAKTDQLAFTVPNQVDANALTGGGGGGGGGGLDAAGVRAAIGMAQADLDTQLDALDRLDVEVSTRLAAAAYQPCTSVTGAGSITAKLIVKDVNQRVLPNVACWISTDADGGDIVAGTLYTDASGQVVFYLDAGTYYLWQQRSGFTFTNPTQFILGDE